MGVALPRSNTLAPRGHPVIGHRGYPVAGSGFYVQGKTQGQGLLGYDIIQNLF